MRRPTQLAVILLSVMTTGLLAGSLSPAERCLTSRVATVTRLAACELRLAAKAIVDGTAADVTPCTDTLASRWAAIDARYACGVAVTTQSVADVVAQFVHDIVALLNPPAPKIIFTTLEIVTPGDNGPPLGFFTYPSRGDEICQRLADASQNPALANKQFVAAVCGSEPDVAGGANLGIAQRTTDSPGGYVRTDGMRIANNLADLLDGSIQVPISHDQHGNLLPDVESGDVIPVWTGCNAAGQSLGVSLQCSGPPLPSWWFSSSIAYAEVGRPDRSDSGWFDTGVFDSCIVGRHLYCIEQ
jgi:hypothetical protein